MTEIQVWDGDGQDPHETGQWDAIDQAAIDYQHRIDAISPEDWSAVWNDLGRLIAIGQTTDDQTAKKIMHGHYAKRNIAIGAAAGLGVSTGHQNMALGMQAMSDAAKRMSASFDEMHERMDQAMRATDEKMKQLDKTVRGLGKRP